MAYADAISVSLRRRTDFPYLLTARPDPVDFRDVYYVPPLVEIPAFMAPAAVPRMLYSADDTEAFLVRNQSVEGSCTGHALAAVVDMQNAKRRIDGADVPLRVSARMLYGAARVFDEFADDNLPGSSVRGAIKGFWHRGACDEVLMPYLAGFNNSHLSVDVVKSARKVSLGAYFRLRHVLNDYHAALVEAGAILVSAMIHDGWAPSKVSAGKGKIPFSTKRMPRLLGAHAFAIVGYTSEGFLVLNSWGPRWGGVNLAGSIGEGLKPEKLSEIIERRAVPKTDLPGIALWRYEDWETHVLDAWVLRLAAPTVRHSGSVGGYKVPGSATDHEVSLSRSVRESDVVGHIVHLNEGSLVTSGLYATTEPGLRTTARLLAGSDRYRHLLFYAHGGLDTRDQALERARAMIPVFKRNGVYPVFFIWRTGFSQLVGHLLEKVQLDIARRSGTQFNEVADNLLENAVRSVAAPLWKQTKENAKQAFSGPNAAGLKAFRILAEAATARGMGIHLCGQSAGATFIGYLLSAIGQDVSFGSTSLLASACTIKLFNRTFVPNAGTAGDALLYNLPTTRERAPENRLPFYSKSMLWLVSRAFEIKGEAPLAGIEEHWQDRECGYRRVVSNPALRHAASRATAHGNFDNDPSTMNHVLSRILGHREPVGVTSRAGPISDRNGGFCLSEIGDQSLF